MASSQRSKRTSKERATETDCPQKTGDTGTLRFRESTRDGYVLLVDDETASRMADIRQKGTKPELVVRKLVSSLGHRYRVNNRGLPGSPDLANRAKKWAIFVHGCYWHRHPGCKLATTPKRNTEFWVAKFERNVARDAESVEALEEAGFQVLVVWECETHKPEVLLRVLAEWCS